MHIAFDGDLRQMLYRRYRFLSFDEPAVSSIQTRTAGTLKVGRECRELRCTAG